MHLTSSSVTMKGNQKVNIIFRYILRKLWDVLILFSNIATVNRSSSFSQPRTPVSNDLNNSFGRFPGMFPAKSMSLAAGTSSQGATPGGKTIREYDEGMRELKKENFNLKLRIYFLEERMGSSARAAASAETKEGLIQANTDLKVRLFCIHINNLQDSPGPNRIGSSSVRPYDPSEKQIKTHYSASRGRMGH